MEPAFVIAPLIGGLVAMLVRLPPLVGFLAAGFVLGTLGFENTETLETIADLGVTLLLFTIGLKLNVRTLVRPDVWGTAVGHLVASTGIFVGVLALIKLAGVSLLASTGLGDFATIAFALSFSSTVFAVKVLEQRSESRSFYGRLAIGVLVVQDVFAVVFLVAATAEPPSPYAALLVLLIPLAPILRRILQRVGHGEMQVLLGVAMALVLGYGLFDLVGIKGDLGSLVIGLLLAPHPAAADLSKSLFSIKELLLVGFFVSIGLTETPTVQAAVLAVVVVVLLPVKSLLFLGIFTGFRLRRRTATLAALSLATYSEFGLIVTAIATDEGWLSDQWLVVMSISIALSFAVASVVNSKNESIYRNVVRRLPAQDLTRLHPDDRMIEIGDAQAVVIGMGRVGEGAYEQLTDEHDLRVLGIDNDGDKVAELKERELNVVEGDADDSDFWDKLVLDEDVTLVILAMPHHAGNVHALDELRKREFRGTTAAVVQHADQVDRIRDLGADAVFHVYAEAGTALADSAAAARDNRPDNIG